MKITIVGHVEPIAIPTFGIERVMAKVDTGAFSGALHCTDIQVSDDGKTLSFNPMGRADLRTQVSTFYDKSVRSASGHGERRFVVPVEVELHGRLYATEIGLTNRSSMTREVLLGRRFLREHNIHVDVTINGEYDEEWSQIKL